MVVPNYIPDPIEIPGNVTQEPYRVRLQYLRRVFTWHLGSVGLVVGLALAPLPHLSLWLAAAILLACLVALCFVRIGFRGGKAEVQISAWSLPILLTTVALFVRSLYQAGVPVWAALFGIIIAYGYTLLCGRDFSFVGQFVLSLLASSVVIAGLSLAMGHAGPYALLAQLVNAAYLAFYVYDGASLLSRRRLGEELGAVVDLYRDVLNIFGYIPRVIQHWHRHRIWQVR